MQTVEHCATVPVSNWKEGWISIYKVLHRGAEDALVLVALHILVDVVADSLRVAHFAQDAAVGREDTLNGVNGGVRIIAHIQRGITAEIHIPWEIATV